MTIIAEIGQNHCGNMGLAKDLIKLARVNGADLVKFQLFDPDKLYTPDFKLYKEVKEAELSFENAKTLFDYGKKVGMEVFFSVFDTERVKWCEEIGVKRYKIACKMRDKEVWQAICRTGKPTIISYYEPEEFPYGLSNTSMLYCVPMYPTPLNELHFNLHELRWSGFSDHTIGLSASKIALARGAKIIEKHFAIDKFTGVDAFLSMTPDELKELVIWSKVVEQVL